MQLQTLSFGGREVFLFEIKLMWFLELFEESQSAKAKIPAMTKSVWGTTTAMEPGSFWGQ